MVILAYIIVADRAEERSNLNCINIICRIFLNLSRVNRNINAVIVKRKSYRYCDTTVKEITGHFQTVFNSFDCECLFSDRHCICVGFLGTEISSIVIFYNNRRSYTNLRNRRVFRVLTFIIIIRIKVFLRNITPLAVHELIVKNHAFGFGIVSIPNEAVALIFGNAGSIDNLILLKRCKA